MSGDRFKRIEDKIDKITDKVHDIDKTLERNTSSLEEHMKRTELLEKKLEPVETHVSMMNGALKAAGVVGLILGILVAAVKLFSLIR